MPQSLHGPARGGATGRSREWRGLGLCLQSSGGVEGLGRGTGA